MWCLANELSIGIARLHLAGPVWWKGNRGGWRSSATIEYNTGPVKELSETDKRVSLCLMASELVYSLELCSILWWLRYSTVRSTPDGCLVRLQSITNPQELCPVSVSRNVMERGKQLSTSSGHWWWEWTHHSTPPRKWSTMDWTHPGSLTKKKFKVTQSASKVLTAAFSDSLICSWWTSCNMDTQLTPTSSVPRWKACERSSRENDLVFLAMVWFTSKIMSSCTGHGQLRTCCRNLAGKRCTVPHTIRILH